MWQSSFVYAQNTINNVLSLTSFQGSHLITAANFCMNGKLAVAGTYDGRCIFYETEVNLI